MTAKNKEEKNLEQNIRYYIRRNYYDAIQNGVGWCLRCDS